MTVVCLSVYPQDELRATHCTARRASVHGRDSASPLPTAACLCCSSDALELGTQRSVHILHGRRCRGCFLLDREERIDARDTRSASPSINCVASPLKKFIKIHSCRMSACLPENGAACVRQRHFSHDAFSFSGADCRNSLRAGYRADLSARQASLPNPEP